MVCLDAPGPHRNLTQEPGVVVAGPLVFPKGIRTLSAALRSTRRRGDVFHALDPYYAFPATYLARVFPRIVSLGTDPGLEIAMRYGPAAGAVTRAAMVPFLSQSVAVTTSQALAERFHSYHARLIPHALDLRKFERLPTAEEARRLRGLPTDRTLLTY